MTPGGRPTPDALTVLSFALLAVLAGMLLAPLLGFGRVPKEAVAGVLAARLGIQVVRARTRPELRRPVAWLTEAAILVLLLGAPG